MAEPLGFYKKHGLNASVKRAAGWAMIRDWAVNKEVDAAHMLTPMPLAITLGAGSVPDADLHARGRKYQRTGHHAAYQAQGRAKPPPI